MGLAHGTEVSALAPFLPRVGRETSVRYLWRTAREQQQREADHWALAFALAFSASSSAASRSHCWQ